MRDDDMVVIPNGEKKYARYSSKDAASLSTRVHPCPARRADSGIPAARSSLTVFGAGFGLTSMKLRFDYTTVDFHDYPVIRPALGRERADITAG